MDRWTVRLVAAALASILAAAHPARSAETAAEQGIAVLVYHRLDPAKSGETMVTVNAFERQLDWLESAHVPIVPLRSVVDGFRGLGPPVAAPAAVVTFDDGHESVYSLAYPIIQKRHIPVTLFIYPSAISNASYALTWEQLAEMKRSDLIDIQSHTFWHPNFRQEKKRLSPDAYRKFVEYQLVRSKARLEERLGGTMDILAWPWGIHDAELEAAAAHAGYVAAFALGDRGIPAGPPYGASDGDRDLYALSRHMVGDGERGASLKGLLTVRSE